MFDLGDKVRDKISGFEGVFVAKTLCLNGCIRCGIQSQQLKDAVPIEPYWVDEQQLELVEPAPMVSNNKKTGGPQPVCTRNADPVI